jgi:hypothetical protein
MGKLLKKRVKRFENKEYRQYLEPAEKNNPGFCKKFFAVNH